MISVASNLLVGWLVSGATSLGTVATPSSQPSGLPILWTVLPSDTGYYSFSRNGFRLGISTEAPTANPCASISGLDTSMWKLIRVNRDRYKIVNKQSGLPLAQTSPGAIVQEIHDSLSAGWNEWQLVLPSAAQK